MHKFKIVMATPEQSLITPIKAQISETNDDCFAHISLSNILQTMPVGSKGIIYKNEKNGCSPVMGYEHTEGYGVRQKDVIMYLEYFIK